MRARPNITREKAGLRPSGRGTNPSEALAAELLEAVRGGKPGRRLRRSLSPIMGGREGANDRGRPPATLGRRGSRSFSDWRATGRRPATVKAENRARNRQARRSRKAGR